MLNEEMKTLVKTHTAGMVATVNADGTPAVSPKATFVVVDDQTIAFGNLRSPGTLANLRRNPAVEVCFIDVLARKAVRITGQASIHKNDGSDAAMDAAFAAHWADYTERMSLLVRITVSRAEMILSPAYDSGATEQQLRATNLARLNAL
jgi:general stress protein 26